MKKHHKISSQTQCMGNITGGADLAHLSNSPSEESVAQKTSPYNSCSTSVYRSALQVCVRNVLQKKGNFAGSVSVLLAVIHSLFCLSPLWSSLSLSSRMESHYKLIILSRSRGTVHLSALIGREGYADAALIAKWKKSGYGHALCCH